MNQLGWTPMRIPMIRASWMDAPPNTETFWPTGGAQPRWAASVG